MKCKDCNIYGIHDICPTCRGTGIAPIKIDISKVRDPKKRESIARIVRRLNRQKRQLEVKKTRQPASY